MRNTIQFKSLLLFILIGSAFFISCNDEKFLGNPNRLFRPIVKKATYSGTWINLQWDRYTGAISYEIQLSVDSFKTILRTDRTDSTIHLVSGLDYDTHYQIRMRSIGDSILSTGDTIRSDYYTLPDITTLDYPTFLTAPTSSDVIDNSIRVKWTVNSIVYTRIDVMVTKDSVYKSVTLDANDNQAGMKIISGLQPATSYYVKIFQNNNYMGKKIFKTSNSQVFSGDIVDLRNYSNDVSTTLITQTFIDSISAAHPNGLNLILSGGTVYNITVGLQIPVSMNIVTGLSFNGKAILAMDGSFCVKAATNVGKLRFEKVFFSEGPTKLKTSGYYGATYALNFNQPGGNLDSLVLENCYLKYKRGAIRMQTTCSIKTMIIDNCFIDSIAGYGVINNGNDGSYIGDILVRNSTIAHSEKVFVGGKALGINSITLQNITTCYSPTTTTNYILDYNGNTIPGGITITNSLFGAGGAATANGMRSSCANITITNSYRATDLTWTLNTAGTDFVAPINDLVDFGAATNVIFADPTHSNFKVTDPKLVSKIGDPRWW